MVDVMMKTNYCGLFDNVNLPTSKVLTPLLEAISNAIQAIEDSNRADGKIVIEILRDVSSVICADFAECSNIVGFRITDNGEGFNRKNFEAFNEVYTKNKVKRGGKGYGRITWLCVFRTAEITSVYKDGDLTQKRHFYFEYSNDPIRRCEDDSITLLSSEETKTEIVLKDIRCDNEKLCNALV